ncbi:16368_t:CDS:1 [Dentiscutata erythropus]|uniref:16368_t:CDS:1 n=1 Tax=Dentiscutata erythropus TaxID=1348616 RepID=A0A9N9IUK3_9GLOM|nr:16368_t:CDS:1 [Dentiscutata erythropus]
MIFENDDDIDILVEDLIVKTSSEVRELISNIEEYTNLINQLAITEDALMDISIIEMMNYEFDEEAEETKDNDEEDLSPPPPITIAEATEALEKVIRYQESLEIEKVFKENELMMLRKKLKEWHYEKTKNKKQLSILSFFGL